MTYTVGKYKILENENQLKVTYRYGVNDFLGFLFSLLGFSLGIFILYVFYYNFPYKEFSLQLIILPASGGFLSWWFGRIIFMSLVTFKQPVLIMDRTKRIAYIYDFRKKEAIPFDEIIHMSCALESSGKHKNTYGMFYFHTKNKQKMEGFIINSSYFIDMGRKIDREIITVANQLRSVLTDYINHSKTESAD